MQALSRTRLREAQSLARAGLYEGAYYLAGYAVECALKACIAKETKKHEFPDRKRAEASHKHNLGELVKVAHLEDARRAEAQADELFRNNWDIVQSWSEESRYRTIQEKDSLALVEAVAHRKHGVLQWIRRHW